MPKMSTISLPQELHDRIRGIAHRDGFASEAEVIALALQAMEHADLRNAGFELEDLEAMDAAMAALDQDPSRGRTSEQVAATLAAEYRPALKAG